ncbi:MAG: hypothetical protein ACODAJ_03980 [Planctomycetota bacterium]
MRMGRARSWCWAVVLVSLGSVASGAVGEHVTQIAIAQVRLYEDPGDAEPSYNFLLQVETDPTVDHIEFVTAAGQACEIPPDERTENGDVYTSHTASNGVHRWVYGGHFAEPAALDDYGDGTYTVTVYYAAGGSESTEVYYGSTLFIVPKPMPWPTDRPTLTYPDQMASVTSPVTFTWEPSSGFPDVLTILLVIESKLGRGEPQQMPHLPTATQSDPVDLAPGLWLTQLAFGSLHDRDNADGVPVIVSKAVASAYEFAVNTGPPDTIAVGGERYGYISQPGEIDEMAVELTEGDELVLDVEAMSIGSQLDAEVVLAGPEGELARGNDGADMGDVLGLSMELRHVRTGNAGTPSGEARVAARSRDPRVYVTVPASGSCTMKLGDRAAMQGTGDGASGKDAHYWIRLLPAADLPASELADTVVTLDTPAGVESLAYGMGADGEDGYFLAVEDTVAALDARFPDGDYILRAEPPAGDPAERPFAVVAPWPGFPHVDQPSHGATEVAEPVHVAWQPVTDAEAQRVGVRRAGPHESGIEGGQWDVPLGQASFDVPSDATARAQSFAVGVEGRVIASEPHVDVVKVRETRVEVQCVRDVPGLLVVDTAVTVGGHLNPNGPAPGSLGILRLQHAGNAADTTYAIRCNGQWLSIDPATGHAFASASLPEWRLAAEWEGRRLRGLDAGATCSFVARARTFAGRHSDLEDAGACPTNLAADANRSGRPTALDYALIKAALLRGQMPWPCDVNDDAAVNPLDLDVTAPRILAPR